MKRIFSLILSLLLLVTALSAAADGMYVVEQKDITVTYNGETINFPDAKPLIQNGKTLVPVRAIMERAKLSVNFDGETRKVTADKEGLSIEMLIDSTEAIVKNGETAETITLEEPARIIEGRTFVPIRFIAESMNLTVNWNPNYREVIIIDTAEWKQVMAEQSHLLCYFLDLADHHSGAVAGNFSGSISLSTEGQALTLSASGTNVFDGENTGTNLTFGADFTALSSLLKRQESLNPTLLSALSKKHGGNLDVVIGADKNIYVKGAALTDLLADCGKETEAEKIGNHYVAIPASQLIPALLPTETDAISTWESPWELLSVIITSDKNLYSQSVAMIDDMVHIVAELYRDDAFKKSDSYGTEVWRYAPDKAEYEKLTKRLDAHLSAIFGTQAQDKAPAIPTIRMDMEKGLPAKIEIAQKTDALTLNFGITSRKFDNYKDSKVSLPKNSIPISEVLGCSLGEFLKK